MQDANEKKELEQKILSHRILQARLESLLDQREEVLSKIAELQNTLKSLEEVEKSEDVLFSLGSDTYIFGRVVEKNKVIIKVGANVALEKTFEEGREMLRKREEELKKLLEDLEKDIEQTSRVIEELTPEIQKLVEKTSKP